MFVGRNEIGENPQNPHFIYILIFHYLFMIELIYTDWGVANTYRTKEGYIIEVNKKLDEFPELKEKIINHEYEHARVKEKGLKGFKKQRKIDALTNVKFRDLFPFYKKYPKTFIQQYSPITYKDNTIYFEWSLIFMYAMYTGLGFLVYFLIQTFSSNQQVFWNIVSKMFWIFLGIIGFYLLGKKIISQANK